MRPPDDKARDIRRQRMRGPHENGSRCVASTAGASQQPRRRHTPTGATEPASILTLSELYGKTFDGMVLLALTLAEVAARERSAAAARRATNALLAVLWLNRDAYEYEVAREEGRQW